MISKYCRSVPGPKDAHHCPVNFWPQRSTALFCTQIVRWSPVSALDVHQQLNHSLSQSTMRLVPALLLTVRWSQGEIHTSPLRRRDRKLDNFFEGGSVSGSYSYNYGVQQQQIATTPPTPSPVDPTLLPTPVPFTPSTGLPTAGNGLDSPTGTSLTNGPTSASGAGTNAPTPTAGTILPTIGHSLTPPPANAFTIQPTYEYGSSKSWKGDPIYKKLKGVKIPKSKAPLPFKTLIPKGAKSSKGYPSWPPPAEVPPSLPMYPVSSKGVPPPPPPKDSSSSKGGPKGKSDSSSSKEGPPGKSSKSKDGPHESSEYGTFSAITCRSSILSSHAINSTHRKRFAGRLSRGRGSQASCCCFSLRYDFH